MAAVQLDGCDAVRSWLVATTSNLLMHRRMLTRHQVTIIANVRELVHKQFPAEHQEQLTLSKSISSIFINQQTINMATNATYGTEAARIVGLNPSSLANSPVTLFVPTDEVSGAL
jgi:hypothetical protein